VVLSTSLGPGRIPELFAFSAVCACMPRSSLPATWRTAAVWLVVFAAIAVVLSLSAHTLVPPPALGRDAPAEKFSEGRARDIVAQLTQGIGRRVNGTEGYRKAVAYLSEQLRKLPGVEVAIQPGSGVNFHRFAPWAPFVFQNTNVLGRLPGKSSDAILLDAHFDTLADSVGAADDAAGVACVVEILRVLAREQPLDRTIVVNLNGGEERGGLGALAFLKHPWAKDIRAYVYLEALPGGRAVLIGSGPGQPWLAKTFAHAAPLPLGNILAQELTQSGLLPFDGDFTPFHQAGLVGLDVAMVGDAWGLHTDLDRLDRLEAGGMQHMGDVALAATRALASVRTSLHSDPRPVVYYDILGYVMFAYSITAARWLGVVALVLFIAVVVWARVRQGTSFRDVLGACLWHCLALAAGALAGLLAALILRAVHRPNGWFSLPVLVVACYSFPAAAAIIFMQGWWRKRAMRKLADDVGRVSLTAWIGALFLWALLLLLATLRGVASGYVAFYWLLFGGIALGVSLLLPRARLVASVLGFLPGAIVTIELATLLIANLVPMTGMFPASAPADMVIAVLVSMVTGLVGVVGFTIPCRTGGMGKAALVSAALGLLGIVVTAAHTAHTAARPKRVVAAHAADDKSTALLLASPGLQGMTPLLSFLPNLAPAPVSWPRPDLMSEPFTHMVPAGEPAMLAPKAEVVSSNYDAASNARTIQLHLTGSSPELRLLIPGQVLLGWSASATLPPLPPSESRYLVHFEGVLESGVDFQLKVRGAQPVEVELRGSDGVPAEGPEIDAVRRQLPSWTTLGSFSFRVTRLSI
jgi:hypothetical protein